jgi:hypothetical protein
MADMMTRCARAIPASPIIDRGFSTIAEQQAQGRGQ